MSTVLTGGDKTMHICIRPMPQTGTQDREKLRRNDYARCLCGQPTCRDSDIKRKVKA